MKKKDAPASWRLPTAAEFVAAPRKAIALIGMSGVGKTRLADMLRATGGWFHYSVDYRIGTRYLNEPIVDLFKKEAMKSALLRSLLLSDSIAIESKIRFKNLAPLTTYLGKPGAIDRGGLPFAEYLDRQRRHRAAEIAAMRDTAEFLHKARDIYGYPSFLCDSSGSLVEIVDPDDPADPVMLDLTRHVLVVLIEGKPSDEDELVRRFTVDPKPMYYEEPFLLECWRGYLSETGEAPETVDPDAFARWGFRRLVRRRAPRYRAIADRWGVAIAKDDVAGVEHEDDLVSLIADALAGAESDAA